MKPEDALDAATAAAAERRAQGGYADMDQITRAQLLEWALVDPDLTKLRSTRRAGAPITWVKRQLLRGLQQYHNEINYQQTRFNIHVLRKLLELEDRVEHLERRAAERRDP
jgi:hypothetical protein